MSRLNHSYHAPIVIVFIALIMSILACSGGIQPENMQIASSLQTDCGDTNTTTSTFGFGEWATTQASEAHSLRIQIEIVRIRRAMQGDVRLVVYRVTIENQGNTPYALIPSLQLYILQVGGETGIWGVSSSAMNEAGLNLDSTILDVTEIRPNQSLTLDMAAYTPIGAVEAISYILDPLAESSPNNAQWRADASNPCPTGV